jgi:hypothetical protein
MQNLKALTVDSLNTLRSGYVSNSFKTGNATACVFIHVQNYSKHNKKTTNVENLCTVQHYSQALFSLTLFCNVIRLLAANHGWIGAISIR